jgi:hypothetical protein
MKNVYYIVELTLILFWFGRILLWKIIGNKFFNFNHIEIFLFYLIWLINCIWAFTGIWRHHLFYFVHSAFPIVLSFPIIIKCRTNFSLCLLIFLILLSLYFTNFIVILILNVACISVILNRIVEFSLKSRNLRQRVPLYVSVLAVLIITQLVFLANYVKVNWYDSRLVDYFLFLTQFVCLTSILISHVYLRRFIVN